MPQMAHRTIPCQRKKGEGEVRRECHVELRDHVLRDVPICGRLLRHTLEILTINEALNTPLDHVDIWNKAGGQLREDLGHELRMDELLALSGECQG